MKTVGRAELCGGYGHEQRFGRIREPREAYFAPAATKRIQRFFNYGTAPNPCEKLRYQ